MFSVVAAAAVKAASELAPPVAATFTVSTPATVIVLVAPVTLEIVRSTLSEVPETAAAVNPKVALEPVPDTTKSMSVEPIFVNELAAVEFDVSTLVTPVAFSSETVPAALNVALTFSNALKVGAYTPVELIVAAIVSTPAPPATLSSDDNVMSPLTKPKLKVSAADVPVSVSIAVDPTSDAAVTGVVSVDVSVLVVVLLEPPHAANDRAIKETPPARAAFAFFFSQTAANFSAVVRLSEASISFRNAPVEIMFIFLLHTKFS
jgi:hypothetical protein